SKDCFVLTGDDWNLKLSSDKKTLALDAPIWVVGTGAQQCKDKDGNPYTPNADGPGTKSHPYDSIEHACNAMTDSNVDYTILIDGTLTAEQRVYKYGGISAAKINIEGANGLYTSGDKAGEPKDSIDGSSVASNDKDCMLSIDSYVDVTIKNLKITGGDRSWRTNTGNVEGGGICLKSGKTLTLSSGTLITENKAGQGGGVYVRDATLVIEDGAKITKNTATGGGNVDNFGGGVYLRKWTTNGNPVLKMSGGEISGNSASQGGGVGLYKASFFMYGNAIIGADLPENQVGSSDTNMGCNKANCGGGIYPKGGSNVYLGYEDANEDGSPKTPHKLEKGVIGNYSYGTSDTKYGGGGIYWSYASDGGARIYMASGQIAKNAAENKGGAIYYYSGSNTTSTLTIGGDASIPALTGAGMNDVYLLSPATLAGALTKHGASNPITITPGMSHGATVFKTDPERVLTSDDLKCFKLSAEQEADGLALTLSSDCKSIKLDKPIFVRKGGSTGADGTKTKPFASIQDACATSVMTSASLDYTILVDGIDPTTGYSMPLLGAQTIPEGTRAASITLMGANGLYPADHSSKAGEPKDAIDGSRCTTAAVLTAECSCPVILGNIKITNANRDGRGGGVYRTKGDLYIQEGTLITGNKANDGLGVYIEGANLYMSGGKISGNESTLSSGSGGIGGGITAYSKSGVKANVFIYGSAVIGGVNEVSSSYPSSKKDALDNGGNYAFNISGGGIGCNESNLYLGYKSANDDGSPKDVAPWTGGIYGNYAGAKGGGVFVENGKMYMNSGQIAYNATNSDSSGGGGGVSIFSFSSGASYACYGKLSGGKIHHNYSKFYGGGVDVSEYDCTKFEMTGGEIYANEALKKGGGVCVEADQNGIQKATFIMSGGSVYGNKVTWTNWRSTTAYEPLYQGDGGGIYNKGKTFIYGSAVIGQDGDPVNEKDAESVSNSATLRGGGIYNYNGGNLYLGYKDASGDGGAPTSDDVEEWSGGIYCNQAQRGGGIYGSFWMSGGTIKGNYSFYDSNYDSWFRKSSSAKHYSGCGGGVAVESSVVYMTGGLITQNLCDSDENAKGSGVHLAGSSCQFHMSGPACVLPESDGT
ncbi:MAG: hypothetical protein J6X95_09280, partial [Treponema sp.]|nr:hypothetical protein [Treponema sp.]